MPRKKKVNDQASIRSDRMTRLDLKKIIRIRNVKYSTFMDPLRFRMVELMDTRKELDRHCLLTKVTFLGSLGLLPNYCVGLSTTSPNNLRALCIRRLIKLRHEEVARNDHYTLDEKRRRISTEEFNENSAISGEELKTDSCTCSSPSSSFKSLSSDVDILSLSSKSSSENNLASGSNNGRRLSCCSKYCKNSDYRNGDEYVRPLVEEDVLKMRNENSDNEKEESIKDCLEKLIRIGAKITFHGPPPPQDIRELIERSNSLNKENNEIDSDDEGWQNWEENVLSLIQRPTCSHSG